MQASKFTSATLTAHGNEAPTRIRMGCSGSTFQKGPISACTISMILRPWLSHSTPGPEKPSAGKHQRRLSTNCYARAILRVLRRTIESAQYAAAPRFNHRRLWNTGSPAFAGDDGWEFGAFVFTTHLRILAARGARGVH